VARRAGQEFRRPIGALAQDGQMVSLPNGQRIVTLADLSDNLGVVRYGRIESGSGVLGTNFSGVILTGEGLFYGDRYWSILGLNNEELQFGLDAATGMALAGGGAVLLDSNGLTLSPASGSDYSPETSVKWLDSDANKVAVIRSYQIGSYNVLGLESWSEYDEVDGFTVGQLYLAALNQPGELGSASIMLQFDDPAITLVIPSGKSMEWLVGSHTRATFDDDGLHLAKGLLVIRDAVEYTTNLPVMFATPLTSTAWDGDAKTTGDNGVIDLSSVFSVPAGVKGVLVKIIGASSTVGRYFGVGAEDGSPIVAQRVSIAGQNAYMGPLPCPCDANGDLHFYTDGNMTAMYILIYGYYW
jgi:hypothetical protein